MGLYVGCLANEASINPCSVAAFNSNPVISKAAYFSRAALRFCRFTHRPQTINKEILGIAKSKVDKTVDDGEVLRPIAHLQH